MFREDHRHHPQPRSRSRGARRGAVHRHAGHLDRERGAAADPVGRGAVGQRHHLGGQRLRPGLLWLSRISAHGSYAVDVLGTSILIGLGLSIAFVQLTALSVEGVPAQDAGLAGGLVNTTRQVGGAIGLAVLATLAGTATAHAATHQPHLEALTAGYRTAFAISAVILASTAALALLLSRRRTAAPAADRPVPQPAARH
ncbi:hypothetical protein [Streptomyces cavernae]|uniref:hypothetical protein n=1 Tax=Streptomyces cavernae TaxID=2259034 RepID=UPI000FEBDF85|nr:hypothetical protein [Streptomyces cavernae]